MRKWLEIIERYKFTEVSEQSFHPHCPEEKGDLFHIMNDHGSEFEVMNFLHAIVLLFKPVNILETGMQNGYSTLAMASACEFNGQGHVTTLDRCVNAHARAGARFTECGLEHRITPVVCDSQNWTECYDGEPFDFCFFDTDLKIRSSEFTNLYRRQKMTGIWSVHDTSRLRGKTMSDYQQSLVDDLDEHGMEHCVPGIENHLSRGFRFFQLT